VFVLSQVSDFTAELESFYFYIDIVLRSHCHLSSQRKSRRPEVTQAKGKSQSVSENFFTTILHQLFVCLKQKWFVFTKREARQ
jgi:hypothetical protein